MDDFWTLYGRAAGGSVGFFWKSGWAFVFGYFISAMIQVFAPKARLTPHMGGAGAKSVSVAALFGAASSSCSFAALSAARSLVLKGAHFTAAVAFMFASTNLVIELGILILIFLGWQFLAAEIVGGIVLIAVSSSLINLTYPADWLKQARKKVETEMSASEEDFDWRKRLRERRAWRRVGHQFVMEWKMVREEILIGFTVAGLMAVFVPTAVWEAIFLTNLEGSLPGWLIALENAVVAPFVAAMTFIGSMGNIPLATVLNSNGVLFAGIMGFIYSDLMVPPLIRVNAKYYGWRVALYIAGVMFASIVVTTLLLHFGFGWLGITPHSGREIDTISRFAFDYTFWLSVAFAGLTVWLVQLHQAFERREEGTHEMGAAGWSVKRVVILVCIVWLAGGLAAALLN